jgi:hypothetical protein
MIYEAKKSELVNDEKQERFIEKKYRNLLEPFFQKRNDIISSYGFFEYNFQSIAKKWRKHYKALIGSQVAQKIASAVWKKFSEYLFRNGKQITFCPWTDFLSIEGKTNDTNITYKDGIITMGTRKSKRFKLKAKIAAPPKEGCLPSSAFLYEQEALSHRIKYCRIIRRAYREGWRYFVQLVLEGEHPVKKKPSTGEPLHPIGVGRVGHDIGTQTVASCSNSRVILVELAASVQKIENELMRINRAMDCSRRATNPDLFSPNGEIIHIDKLPAACLTKRGKRKWKRSKHYEELACCRRFLYRKQTDMRIQCHNELANQILSMGNEHYIETMSFKALAKKAKPQSEEERKAKIKPKRRKRFGKSVANKAPATFVNILEKKVLEAGGIFSRINTWQAKASQYNHLNHQYNKKKLSQRWNKMPDGKKIQRDLYSAFLIQHSNIELNGFIQALCDLDYPNFVVLHDREIKRLQGNNLPSSTGIC